MTELEATHPSEPHSGGLANRLNWLRAGVLGANDGIVSVAAIAVGVAGATPQLGPIIAAAVAGLVGGAVSMALGEYVSVSSQRDSERALIAKEETELAEMPHEELAELTKLYEEVRRGELGMLARAAAQAEEPRGEIVIVVAPPDRPAEVGAADLDALLRQALERLSVKEAVAEIAAVCVHRHVAVIHPRPLGAADGIPIPRNVGPDSKIAAKEPDITTQYAIGSIERRLTFELQPGAEAAVVHRNRRLKEQPPAARRREELRRVGQLRLEDRVNDRQAILRTVFHNAFCKLQVTGEEPEIAAALEQRRRIVGLFRFGRDVEGRLVRGIHRTIP